MKVWLHLLLAGDPTWWPHVSSHLTQGSPNKDLGLNVFNLLPVVLMELHDNFAVLCMEQGLSEFETSPPSSTTATHPGKHSECPPGCDHIHLYSQRQVFSMWL